MDFEPPEELTPLHKAIGQMFMTGFSGYKVTPEIKELIEKYHIGSIILSVKNLKDAESTRELIYDLQKIAHDAGHEYPLLIGIDQENGMLNNLHDEKYISQFPGPMAIVATKSTDLARDVAHATGLELKSLGINWLFGPVLDVLTNSANRLLGVRTMGDDPQEVTKYGQAFFQGYSSANLVCCGKHFPGYGSATVDSILGLPIVSESIEQLETASLIPFRQLSKDKLDAIMVGGCALPKIAISEMHACLSERVTKELLREDIGYEGVILSECLEMDALYENVGVRQGAVMAATAGCDIILVCSSFRLQKEAISGIFGAVQNGIIDEESIFKSAERVANAKRKRTNWQETLNPPPLTHLMKLKEQHQMLSKLAYENSVTVLRDHAKNIPLPMNIEPDSDILILTPLVTPIITTRHSKEVEHLLLGETVFQDFGKSIAKIHGGKVLHASYTANGLTNLHDGLIERAKAVIVVTADANRNMYQIGFTKHVGVICSQQRKPLICVAASSPYDLALDRGIGTYVCIYEFTFEALDACARVLFGLLPAKGTFPGSGLYQRSRNLLGEKKSQRSSRGRWLVEKWAPERDMKRLQTLWENCFPDRRLGPGLEAFKMLRYPLKLENHNSTTTEANQVTNSANNTVVKTENDEKQKSGTATPSQMESAQTHFIVRNSSTNNLYGFCATWVYPHSNVGCIAMIFVEPSRRGMQIGHSLHDRAIKYLINERKVDYVQLGGIIPAFFEGIPFDLNVPFNNTTANLQWFKQSGWDIDIPEAQSMMKKSRDAMTSRAESASPIEYSPGTQRPRITVHNIVLLTDLQRWSPTKKLISELELIGIRFDICQPDDSRMDAVLELIRAHYDGTPGLYELYEQARHDGKIIIAIDPVKKTMVGSIILFTRSSPLAGLMPWILEFEDARIGGLCGIATDPEYRDLTNVFTLGLVGCGVRQFKLQGFDRCVIDGVTDRQVAVYRDNGFKLWRRYVSFTNPSSQWSS
ncbi:hypothetical protein TRVA0_010S02740 [Trichomonascus vanleenenianus]|uniref:uncharacterized protein n=1 Tax=Trichomonascus vanleenenianus TaxID=2268995 RepID=UPI003ECB1167